LSVPSRAAVLRRLAETLSFACLLEENPELRPADLRRLLSELADGLETAGPSGGAHRAEASGTGPDPEPDEPQEPAEGSAAALELPPETVATMLVDVFVDGASRGNPGPSSIGYVLAEPGGIELVARGVTIGNGTNNYAEYKALLRALEEAKRYGFRRLRIHSDSQLLVRQIEGQYKVNHPGLRVLWEEAKRRLATFDEVRLLHVPREQNHRADALANEALKEQARRRKAAEAGAKRRAGRAAAAAED
jgi:ribonuclease HI